MTRRIAPTRVIRGRERYEPINPRHAATRPVPWTSSRRPTTPSFVSDVALSDWQASLGRIDIRCPPCAPHETQGSPKRDVSETTDRTEKTITGRAAATANTRAHHLAIVQGLLSRSESRSGFRLRPRP